MNGVEGIAAERRSQVELKGWTPEHDDEHDSYELLRAAECYVFAAYICDDGSGPVEAPDEPGGTSWPWDPSWWKPSNNPIRNLEKAGALIAAEIDRLLRKRNDDLERKLDDMGVQ